MLVDKSQRPEAFHLCFVGNVSELFNYSDVTFIHNFKTNAVSHLFVFALYTPPSDTHVKVNHYGDSRS